MYTQCPDCLTVFSLDAGALSQAGGQAQCGHCGQTFDALANLARQLPPEPFERLEVHPSASQPPRLELAVYRPQPEPVDLPEEVAPAPDPRDFSQLKFTPRFARGARDPKPRKRERPQRRPARRGLWIGLCLLLALALGAQLAWAWRDALLSDRTTGAWLRQACATLGCRLPLVRDVTRLQLLARDVQPLPNDPGALMISARFRNAAPFVQPYPAIVVTFSDAHGKALATRRVPPAMYLNDPAAQRAGLASGATTTVLIQAADPGRQAVAFEFSFE